MAGIRCWCGELVKDYYAVMYADCFRENCELLFERQERAYTNLIKTCIRHTGDELYCRSATIFELAEICKKALCS